MEYSNLLKNARDIDEKKGIVSFYFADFNSIDTHGRRMQKNAFNRTFNNNFKRFAHLLNHDPNVIIGKPIEVSTDEKGAYMVSQLSKSSHGKDALIQYQEGIYNEHSFGFLIKDSVKEGEVEIVNELQMFEASTVTWGANEATPMISLNQVAEYMERNQGVADMEKKLDYLIEQLGITDIHKRLESLEIDKNESILNKLESIIARLPAEEHQTPLNEEDDIQSVINFINKY